MSRGAGDRDVRDGNRVEDDFAVLAAESPSASVGMRLITVGTGRRRYDVSNVIVLAEATA